MYIKTLIKEKPEQIMLDGKAIKSTDAIRTIETMMNIVTAYTDTGICLGQKTVSSKSNEIPAVRELIEILNIEGLVVTAYTDTGISILQTTVDSKSNEIPAVQELISMLNIKGMVVTADAMHCQKETAETIIKNKGDYVLQLKANQGRFYEDVYAMFDDKYITEADKDCEYEIFSTIEKSHGRIEKRTCYVLNELEFFTDYLAEWKGLKKIFAVKREVEKNQEKTTEISCYLSSKNTTAENLLSYTRKHWEIESMHHILDVTYDEDRCKLLTQRAQENVNIFRKMGISIHKNHLKNKKQTVKSSMFNYLLNDNLLLEVIRNITEL